MVQIHSPRPISLRIITLRDKSCSGRQFFWDQALIFSNRFHATNLSPLNS